MGYSLTTSTPAAVEPLSRTDAKLHLQIAAADTTFDVEIDQMIADARRAIEDVLGRQLVTATLQLQLDEFPDGAQPILVPRGQLQSVSAINYTDTAGVLQTLAATYQVVSGREPGEIHPVYAGVWPVTRRMPNAVTIDFMCGYGLAAAVPEAIVRAARLLVGHYFANREAVLVGVNAGELPLGVQRLLAPYQIGEAWIPYGGE